MDVPVLTHPKAEDLPRIYNAVNEVNRLQNYFRLNLQEVTWLPNGTKPIPAPYWGKKIRKYCGDKFAIAIINNRFTDDYFSHSNRDGTIITVWDWEALFAPPALKTYLIYEMAGGLLDHAADLSDELLENHLLHNPSIGCFFDFCEEKESIALGMVAGNVCGACEANLMALGLESAALSAIEKLLAHVRAETIRRPSAVPFRIFIGHGHDPAWKTLEKLLVDELHLDVIEFNRDPTAGISTAERLVEMLQKACFAFIVMTGEDSHEDQRKHARANVIHEAGFFQGRLGFKRAIILKEEGCAEFSNNIGLTYIPFPKNNLLKAKEEIIRTLRREGVLPAQ